MAIREICTRLLTFVILFFACNSVRLSVASADTYRMYVEPPLGTFNSRQAGRVVSFEALYDTASTIVTWKVVFAPQGGVLPDGYWLVYTHTGLMPEGHDGEWPIFFFDNTDITDPVLTAYAYNSNNPIRSWSDGSSAPGIQSADKIFSSKSDPQGYLKNISVSTQGQNRVLSFSLDISGIESHTPLHPDPLGHSWKGAAFADQVGLWFQPVALLSTAYDQNGFLTEFSPELFSFYDRSKNDGVVHNPICEGITDAYTLRVGELFERSFIGTDPQHEKLTVTYSGLPSGAVRTPAGGTVVNSPATATIRWTPEISSADKTYPIDVIFTDPHGIAAHCPFELTVVPNVTPQCSSGAAGAYQGLSCSLTTTTIQLDGSGSIDPDGAVDSLNYAWSTNCPEGDISDTGAMMPLLSFRSETLAGEPVNCDVFLTVSDGVDTASCQSVVTMNGCTRDCLGKLNGTATFDRCGICAGDGLSCLGCENRSVQGDVLDLDIGTNSLYYRAKRLARSLRRIRPLSAAEQERLIDANKIHVQAWIDINSIPSEFTSCSNTEFCARFDHSDFIKAYQRQSGELQAIVEEFGTKIRKAARVIPDRNKRRKVRRRAKNSIAAGQQLDTANQQIADQLPTFSSECS